MQNDQPIVVPIAAYRRSLQALTYEDTQSDCAPVDRKWMHDDMQPMSREAEMRSVEGGMKLVAFVVLCAVVVGLLTLGYVLAVRS